MDINKKVKNFTDRRMTGTYDNQVKKEFDMGFLDIQKRAEEIKARTKDKLKSKSNVD